jgi:signal transduction histidine kinase
MALLRFWRNPSKKTAVLFLSAAAVSVFVLVWMGVRLLQQDRILEDQRLEEKREVAADRFTAALEKALSEEEKKLDENAQDNFSPISDDVVLIIADSREFRVFPEKRLLYYPEISPGREAPAHLFANAEGAEFQDQNYNRAIRILRPLSQSKDPAVRTGALVRMARNFRKAGRPESALEIYNNLAAAPAQGITVSGVPIDLVASRFSCHLLEELGRMEDLQRCAKNLKNDLTSGRWHLDRSTYIYYSEKISQWPNQESESDAGPQAVAQAVHWLWQNLGSLYNSINGSSGRRLFNTGGIFVTALWHLSNNQLTALVAGPNYQQNHWFDPILGSPELDDVNIRISDAEGVLVYGFETAEGSPQTSRPAYVTGLPWNVSLVNAAFEAELGQYAQRRRLLMTGLGILAFLFIAVSYLIVRAVSRELAAARLQSDFVSAVSHEFRTPLTSLRQFTEMLVEDRNLSEKKRLTYYSAQERATRRLSRLVESLLDFGRMEAGARPYRLEPLDAGHLVRSIVQDFREESNTDGMAIGCDIPEEGPLVMGDREALAQALWNLLDNAVKYSGDSPDIRIEVEAADQVAIRVRDQGSGIPPSEISRIFRKFERGSSAKTLGIKGTGLGLAMVKHIVDAHQGKILIESEPGKGSTFTILLPLGG